MPRAALHLCHVSSDKDVELMRRQFFWLVTAVILAVIAHVSYVLFMPSRSLNAAIDVALGTAQVNRFTVLDPAAQIKLVPFASAENVVAICKFDVAKAPVKITAQLPAGFWTFAVYTIRGEQVYAINDTQADSKTFSVELSRDGGMLSKLFGGNEDAVDFGGDDFGWRIALNESRGVAILWMAVADPLLRKAAADVISQGKCVKVDR
jgi:hypothetical protein